MTRTWISRVRICHAAIASYPKSWAYAIRTHIEGAKNLCATAALKPKEAGPSGYDPESAVLETAVLSI